MNDSDLKNEIEYWKSRYELVKRAYQLRMKMPNFPSYFYEEIELMYTDKDYE
jgi:hypothetical protein